MHIDGEVVVGVACRFCVHRNVVTYKSELDALVFVHPIRRYSSQVMNHDIHMCIG